MKSQKFFSNKFSRRDFLKRSTIAAGGAFFGLPAIVPASALGSNSPSNRINIGCIGTGNQGIQNMQAFLHKDDVHISAVCDVNTAGPYPTGIACAGREPARKIVDEYYAGKKRSGSYKGCAAYNDFRDVLARDDIDAVLIVTPDHWHAVMTVMAAKAGKDIYCEKPISLTVADGRAMVEAVQRYGIIFQAGSQRRSREQARFAIELVRNGRIGKLKKIICNVGANNKTAPPSDWKPSPIPEGFDYDMWLGPAPWAPYHKDRCFYTFRFILDYSGGQTTNFGAHSCDLAQWGNATDHTMPIEFEDLGSEFPRDGLFNTPIKIHFRAKYENGVELICQTGLPTMQTHFIGTEGWVKIGYGGLCTYPESLKSSIIKPNEDRVYVSNDHHTNFIECVKTRREPVAPVEAGHHSAAICHLGNIAMLLKRKIRLNPETEKIINDEEANRMLSRAMRTPWHF